MLNLKLSIYHENVQIALTLFLTSVGNCNQFHTEKTEKSTHIDVFFISP